MTIQLDDLQSRFNEAKEARIRAKTNLPTKRKALPTPQKTTEAELAEVQRLLAEATPASALNEAEELDEAKADKLEHIATKVITQGFRHYLTPKICSLIDQRLNIYLKGPAGSGKSKCAEQCAADLELPYSAPPIGRETPISQLFGYFNATGQYVRTPLRERVEFGGVLHLEEIDFASPAVGTALNALLANDFVGFPDIVIPKHPDFVCIASANTFGTGATAQYIGSQGLNAATLDRFVFLEFPYDLALEMQIAPCRPWCSHVQEIRRRATALGLNIVISPRATLQGGKMIATKQFTWEEIELATMFKGLDEITIQKLRTKI